MIREEFPKATHYCYAYRFFGPPVITRANDDGEPSNSAGAPILGQIQSFDLFDIAIIVVRFYGGTKLGVSGLIQAYKGSAKQALENAVICMKEPTSIYSLSGSYLSISNVLSILKKYEIKVLSQALNEESHIKIEVPESQKEFVFSKFDSDVIVLKAN